MKIVVIGVGSAGCAVVESLYKESNHDEVKFALIDADGHVFINSDISLKVCIGGTIHGFGGDRSPKKYRKLALEKYDEIKKVMI